MILYNMLKTIDCKFTNKNITANNRWNDLKKAKFWTDLNDYLNKKNNYIRTLD